MCMYFIILPWMLTWNHDNSVIFISQCELYSYFIFFIWIMCGMQIDICYQISMYFQDEQAGRITDDFKCNWKKLVILFSFSAFDWTKENTLMTLELVPVVSATVHLFFTNPTFFISFRVDFEEIFETKHNWKYPLTFYNSSWTETGIAVCVIYLGHLNDSYKLFPAGYRHLT